MRTRIWVGLLTLLSASVASAAPITLPSGLAPGSTYYLAFVTDGSRDATSSTIADYDAFVTAQANSDADLLALGTTWKVIGSTEAESAATHLGLITSPIYNLAGLLVDTGSADLFDGNITNPIDTTQFGSLTARVVFTGSYNNGSAAAGSALGDRFVDVGGSNFTDGGWISVVGVSQFGIVSQSVYGISGPLVVPAAAVPEPATISLMMGPALLLFGRRLRRRRRLATQTTTSDPAVH